VSTGRSHQDMALNYLEFIFPRKGWREQLHGLLF
jgi:hypothetical protein